MGEDTNEKIAGQGDRREPIWIHVRTIQQIEKYRVAPKAYNRFPDDLVTE